MSASSAPTASPRMAMSPIKSAPIRWQSSRKAHGIPFYVAAPYSTIDLNTKSGDDIPIEQRNPTEVTTVHGGVLSRRTGSRSSIRPST